MVRYQFGNFTMGVNNKKVNRYGEFETERLLLNIPSLVYLAYCFTLSVSCGGLFMIAMMIMTEMMMMTMIISTDLISYISYDLISYISYGEHFCPLLWRWLWLQGKSFSDCLSIDGLPMVALLLLVSLIVLLLCFSNCRFTSCGNPSSTAHSPSETEGHCLI